MRYTKPHLTLDQQVERLRSRGLQVGDPATARRVLEAVGMEFGQLVRLYGFMRDADQSRVSKDLAGVSGAVFVRWMKTTNYARNISAHHARLWNRTLTYKLGRVSETAPDLVHLNAQVHGRSRTYAVCALLAFLTQRLHAETAWTSRLHDLMDRFPEGLPVAPETHMGFPDGWRALDLWGG